MWSPRSGASPRRPHVKRVSRRRPWPKIVDGRVNGFFKEFVLIEQASVADNKKTVKQVLAAAGIEVSRFVRFEVGQA